MTYNPLYSACLAVSLSKQKENILTPFIMVFKNNNNEDFLKTFRSLKVKYNGAIVLMKNGEGEDVIYETFLEDADFFIKHLGLHRISKETDPSWVAFPKGAFKEFVKKITKYFNIVVVELLDEDEEGLQLSFNF